jgi:hypothetical protein
MNQESKKTGKDWFLVSKRSLSWFSGFLIKFFPCVGFASSMRAGDAVAIGYNADGIWTSLTYYASSKPKWGKDYKIEAEARDEALRDLHKRGDHQTTHFEILSSSDATGFVAVGRGTDKSGKDANVVGRGKSQAEADESAMAELKKTGATKNQKIVYRYFSYGGASRTGD